MLIKNKKRLVGSIFKKHKIDEEVEGQEIPVVVNDNTYDDNVIPIKKARLSKNEIEDNLMEIYSEDGNMPDFKTIKIKKKKGFFVSFVYFLLLVLFVSSAVYFVNEYIKNNKDAASVLQINITAPDKVVWGEEFFYEIEYNNSSSYTLKNVKIELAYPENFILSEVYSIDTYTDNKVWQFNELGAGISGKIKVRGKIINQEGVNNLLSVKSSYKIDGLSSDFSKENFNSITVSSLPFQVTEEYFSTVLVGEEYPLKININDFPVDKMKEFIINFSGSEIVSVIDNNRVDNTGGGFTIEKIDDKNFKVILATSTTPVFNFKYKVNKKENEQENLSWKLKYLDENKKEFVFFEKQVVLEVIKSDLHLSITSNDNSSDYPVNFGENLDYVIKYSNKGDKNMKDLVIMAVLEGDFLNWGSLNDKNEGNVSRRTISWTYREIPELKELEPGQSGEIKFSIKVADFNRSDMGKSLEIKNYAQFSVGNMEEFSGEEDRLTDNRSNVIINKLNSDLSISEKVLYFNDDNIPVGSGPLPPVVGEKTTFRYYWTVKNSLHELKDVEIELPLPSYIIWDNNFTVSAGNLRFDANENKIFWSINRWPVGVDKIEAEFNVGVIPSDNEYNKIMILSSGTTLKATDVENNSLINKKTDVKTSKLEDDAIASFSNDGRVK